MTSLGIDLGRGEGTALARVFPRRTRATPGDALAFYDEPGNPRSILTRDCVRALKALHEEAEAYVHGARAQMELNLIS